MHNSPNVLKMFAAGFCLAAAFTATAGGQSAATETTPASGSIAVMSVVRWSGTLPEAAGRTIELRFALYQDQIGGLALWSEAQTVKVGADGRYSVLLGATTAEGLPPGLFQAGQARWLEAHILGATGDSTADASSASAGPRSLLAAVPYALKSVDSETLAGRAAADYVTREDLQSAVAASAARPEPEPLTSPTITGTGTTGYLPIWTGASTLGNSVIAESGTKVGIGTAAPASTLDVVGSTTLNGTVSLPATAATATAGGDSPILEFSASSYSSTTKAPVAQKFVWKAASTGNDTAAPTANLELLFGGGTAAPAATGLAIAPTGQLTFAAGQKFPGTGAGSITGVTASSPLTGGGTTGAITLGLSTSALETTLSNVYARLGVANTFTAPITFASGQIFPGTLSSVTAASPITQETTGGVVSLGLNASSLETTLNSVYPQLGAANTFTKPITFAAGQAFPGTIVSVTASSPLTSSTNAGKVILGLSAASLETTLGGVYARLAASNNFTGATNSFIGPVTAATSVSSAKAISGMGTSGATGLFGSSDTAFGVYAGTTTPAAGSAGALGFTGSAFSTTYSSEAGIAYAGVWADNSATGTGAPVALFATGDDVYGGAFVTNGGDFPALYVDNNGGTAIEASASSGYGVSGSTSSGTGVYGSSDGSGDGVEGYSSSLSSQQAGVLGVGNTASNTYDEFNIYSGVWGDTGTSSTTVAPAWAIGVLGTADDSHAGVFLNNSSGWSTMYISNAASGGSTGLFKTFMAVSPEGACGIGSGGSLSCTGQVKTLVSTSGSRQVETYSVQSPENWMEDFGSAELQNGSAVIAIDPAFAETVSSSAGYHVFLTANGDSRGLFVVRKTAASFEVRESGGGSSSIAFDYRIVAKRRGYEAQRLTDVTERFNAEIAANSPARALPGRRPAIQPPSRTPSRLARPAQPGMERKPTIPRVPQIRPVAPRHVDPLAHP
jgi:hypothetical protein